MKTKRTQQSDTNVQLTITLEPHELEAAKQVALTKLARDIKVSGFRQGKVPVQVAAKHVDPATLQTQTLDNALSKAVAEAFLAEGLQALERPSVEVTEFTPDKTLVFTAEATVVPPVKLGNYKKLAAKQSVEPVKTEEVDEIIQRMQRNFATKQEVDRAAQIGDEVVIDFVGKKDNVAFDGGSAEAYRLELGAGQFIPGFEEGIVGHRAGEQFDLPLSFPEDYHVKDLAGAPVVFQVTLQKVFSQELPELNDEFAAKCGPFTDLAELKNDITRELTAQKEREAAEKLKDALVAELAEASKVSLPAILVEDQMRSIEQDMTQNLRYQGLTLEQYLATQKIADKAAWLDSEVRPIAEKRVKAGLVLAELSKELGIEVTRDELQEQITTLKQQYGKNPDMLKRFDGPNVHRDIANRLVTDKTVEALVALNA